MKQKLLALFISLAAAGSIMVGTAGCASENVAVAQTIAPNTYTGAVTNDTVASDTSSGDSANILSSAEGSILDVTEMFTDRDLEQSADLDGATYVTVSSGTDIVIDAEGVYVISGDATDVTIEVDAGDDAKVQLVLDGVNIVNTSSPAISIVSADKAFVTLTDSDNHLEVSGAYESDSLDAVIVSKSDLCLNGTGSLEIVSKQGNGITGKDDLKITGGTYSVEAAIDGIEANDSIRIYDGEITVVAGKDALHSENAEDSSLGYIYIASVTLNISAGDDGIQGNAIVQIDGGVINIQTCTEGIEGTYVQINGGNIDIYATDDGINAAPKSTYSIVIEINGGTINVTMGGGDTDALDSNGDLYINGGTVNLVGNSIFDYMGVGELNGGQVTVNGTVVTQLTPSQMGGMGGGRGTKPSRQIP